MPMSEKERIEEIVRFLAFLKEGSVTLCYQVPDSRACNPPGCRYDPCATTMPTLILSYAQEQGRRETYAREQRERDTSQTPSV